MSQKQTFFIVENVWVAASILAHGIDRWICLAMGLAALAMLLSGSITDLTP